MDPDTRRLVLGISGPSLKSNAISHKPYLAAKKNKQENTSH